MTATEIANRALRRSGVGQTLTDIETDTGEPAEVARDFYETVRDEVMVWAPWSWATQRATLAETGTPPDEWGYSYALPADCLRPLWIETGLRSVRPDQEIEYVIEHDGTGKRLYTDQEDAVLVYVAQTIDTALFSPDFSDALAWRLAVDISTTLQRNMKLAGTAQQMFEKRIQEAYMRDSEGRKVHPPEIQSSLEAARE